MAGVSARSGELLGAMGESVLMSTHAIEAVNELGRIEEVRNFANAVGDVAFESIRDWAMRNTDGERFNPYED